MIKVKLQGGTQKFTYPNGTTKADIARDLFARPQLFSVTEVSQGVGMAYSQAHAIYKKVSNVEQGRAKAPLQSTHQGVEEKRRPLAVHSRAAVGRTSSRGSALQRPVAEYAGGKRPTSKARVAEAKVWAGRKADEVLGSFSKPHPKGKKLGRCANCDLELEGLKLAGQMQMIHKGGTPEYYLSTVQFCHAFPASLA